VEKRGFRVFSVGLWKSVLRLAVRVIVLAVGIFGVRGCRCLRGIDFRRPEVVGTNGGRAVVEKRAFCVFTLSMWQSVLRLAVRGNSISGRVFGVRGCRCLSGIDCRRSEVDGTYGV
jgi:uncharacterized membrane protein